MLMKLLVVVLAVCCLLVSRNGGVHGVEDDFYDEEEFEGFETQPTQKAAAVIDEEEKLLNENAQTQSPQASKQPTPQQLENEKRK
jgi:hypothetical protein